MLVMRNVKYETFGYFVEYWQNGKYLGSINIDKPDRKTVGYNGTQTHIAHKDIIVGKNKIKQNQEYYTRLYPLCGRSNYNVQTGKFD